MDTQNVSAIMELSTVPLPQYIQGIMIPCMTNEVLPVQFFTDNEIEIGKYFSRLPIHGPLFDDAIVKTTLVPEKLRCDHTDSLLMSHAGMILPSEVVYRGMVLCQMKLKGELSIPLIDHPLIFGYTNIQGRLLVVYISINKKKKLAIKALAANSFWKNGDYILMPKNNAHTINIRE